MIKILTVWCIVFSWSFMTFGQTGQTQHGIIPFNVKRIARVTGKSLPGENLPNPNRTDEQYDLGGTDLGIAWEMGKGRVGFFFGDSYGSDFKVVKEGGPGKAGNWRSNVLGISTDHKPEDGVLFDTMLYRQVIHSPHITNGTGSHTAIPTAAIHISGVDYVHYMDVRKWGKPGAWITNFSALYSSSDQGRSWYPCKEVRFAATSNFGQVAYAKKDGYVYMIGTAPGRWGAAYLSRFREKDILNQPGYSYWNKERGWVLNDEASATPVIDAPAGELSLVYHSRFKRWIVTYLNEKKRQLVMRDAAEASGPWSEEKILATAAEYPGLYGAFMYPVKPDGDELYFLMSMWGPYNVFLMKADLKAAH